MGSTLKMAYLSVKTVGLGVGVRGKGLCILLDFRCLLRFPMLKLYYSYIRKMVVKMLLIVDIISNISIIISISKLLL